LVGKKRENLFETTHKLFFTSRDWEW